MPDRPSLAQKVLSAITGMPPATRTESGFRKKVEGPDRRKFRRIQAPVFCRPAGLRVFSKHDEQGGLTSRAGTPIDVSRGGVRVYSDEARDVGERLTLELFVTTEGGEAPSVTFDAEVAWIERLEAGAPGTYDVGLKFVRLSAENEALLAQVLAEPE